MQVHRAELLRDNNKTSHFYFQNGLVSVTKYSEARFNGEAVEDAYAADGNLVSFDLTGIRITPWEELSGHVCVWDEQVIKRRFRYVSSDSVSKFEAFLLNVTNGVKDEDRFDALFSALGYLMHHYYSAANNKAVILYDEAVSERGEAQGGTGKSLIAEALKEVKTVAKINGKAYSITDKFRFDSIHPGTPIVWIDDPKKDFAFDDLFAQLSGWIIERKGESKFLIPAADSPKVFICSNTTLKGEGLSHDRRKEIYELTDYYSKKIIPGSGARPIAEEHGGEFFSSDWSDHDWDEFFSFMIDAAQFYHNYGLLSQQRSNAGKNKIIQTTCIEFVEWADSKDFLIGNNDTKALFTDYTEKHGKPFSDFVQRSFTNWLVKYGKYMGWKYKAVVDPEMPKFPLFVFEQPINYPATWDEPVKKKLPF
jgi:hypothetical protein